MIMFFPIIPFVSLVLLMAYWVVVAAMLYSVGDIEKVSRSQAVSYRLPSGFESLQLDPPSEFSQHPVSEMSDLECYHSPYCGFQVEWNDTFWYMGLYHLFGLLWTVQFIVGYGYVTLAGAIGHYYWYRGDSKLMPKRPVFRAMYNAARYHLGSIALGSLILAVIQFIRLILQYIDKRTRQLQDTSLVLKWCMCCVKCCMWCLEKIVKYINRNAYIMMAIKGTSYCTSAGRAVALIISNALRLLAVSIVGDMLIFLGKLCVVGGCGVAAFFFADSELYTNPEKHPGTFLSSPVAPIVLTVIIAYICASVFFQVYEMAVDTILLCFCEDCDVNGDEPKFAPPLLLKSIGQKPHAPSGQTGQFIASTR
jgi:choline transporter-like protein 2/4/5